MDTTAEEIVFDAQGVCHFCHRADELIAKAAAKKPVAAQELQRLVERVKADGRGRDYDSIMGMSGGVDSSYVAHVAKSLGLRPLVVHFDNGWNSETAVSNIERIVKKLGFDLYTLVINWPEFRDLQRSFFKASVVDIEVVSDHAIFASMYRLARQHGIRYILSGTNSATEHTMPAKWAWRKQDLTNIKAIHREFGTVKLKTFPTLGTLRFQLSRQFGLGQSFVELLNYIDYRKTDAIRTLEREYGWQYYGGKHYESIITKFYQAHVLPVKFGIDKRRPHLTDLIHNGEITRAQALVELEKPLYDPAEFRIDREFVLKKLGFSSDEFEAIMRAPVKSHLDYGSDQRLYDLLKLVRRLIRPR